MGLINKSLHYVLDWEYWLRCQQHFQLHFLDEFLACNRRYDETKTASGGIGRKREIAELLLSHGKFTQRAIQAYLATPHHVVAGTVVPQRFTLKILLAPTRSLEKRIRQFRKAVFNGSSSRESGKSRQPMLRVLLSPSRYLEKRVRHWRKAMFGLPQNGSRHETPHRRVA